MLRLFTELPVQAFSWNDREGHPDLSRGKSLFRGALCGGLGQWQDMHQGSPTIIRDAIRQAINHTHEAKIRSGGQYPSNHGQSEGIPV